MTSSWPDSMISSESSLLSVYLEHLGFPVFLEYFLHICSRTSIAPGHPPPSLAAPFQSLLHYLFLLADLGESQCPELHPPRPLPTIYTHILGDWSVTLGCSNKVPCGFKSRDGVGREVREGFRKEGTHVCLWPIHVDIWQKKKNTTIL